MKGSGAGHEVKVWLIGDGALFRSLWDGLARAGMGVGGAVPWEIPGPVPRACTLMVVVDGPGVDTGAHLAVARGAGAGGSDIPALLVGAGRIDRRLAYVAGVAAALGARRIGPLVIALARELVAVPSEQRAKDFRRRVSATLHGIERLQAFSAGVGASAEGHGGMAPAPPRVEGGPGRELAWSKLPRTGQVSQAPPAAMARPAAHNAIHPSGRVDRGSALGVFGALPVDEARAAVGARVASPERRTTEPSQGGPVQRGQDVPPESPASGRTMLGLGQGPGGRPTVPVPGRPDSGPRPDSELESVFADLAVEIGADTAAGGPALGPSGVRARPEEAEPADGGLEPRRGCSRSGSGP